MRLRGLAATITALLMFTTACASGEADPDPDTGDGDGSPAAASEEPDGDSEEASEETPEELTPITVVQPVDGYAFMPVYASLSLGYFEEEGLDVEFVVAGAGGQELSAILSGSGDIAVSAGVPLVLAAAQGQEVVGVLNTFAKASVALALHPDTAEELGYSPDMSYDERVALLAGLKTGMTAPATLTDIMARYYATAAGLNPDTDLEIVSVGPGTQGVAALESGNIEAFVPIQPFTSILEANGTGEIIFDPTGDSVEDPQLTPWLEQVVVVTRQWAEENPDLMDRAMRALLRGNQWIADSTPEEIAEMLSGQEWASSIDLDISVAAVEAYQDGVPRDGVIDPEGLRNVMEVLQQVGTISDDIVVEDHVDNSWAG